MQLSQILLISKERVSVQTVLKGWAPRQLTQDMRKPVKEGGGEKTSRGFALLINACTQEKEVSAEGGRRIRGKEHYNCFG